ncbi:MAG: HAD family hydrolase [Infirmifilum sp.]
MKSTVEAVFFDMGGTLVYDTGFQELLGKRLASFVQKHYQILLSDKEALELWKETAILPGDLEAWDLVRAMFFLRRLGVTPKPEAVEKLYSEVLESYVEGFRLDPEALHVIDALSSKGIKIGIISNVGSYEILSRRLREAGVMKYIDVIVASQAFAFKKPSPQIFFWASYLIGAEPSKCVHVGDDPIADIEGAKSAGFRTIQVLKYARSDSKSADALVQTIGDVIHVIERWLNSP